jgi:hypothetical protein
MFTTKVGANIRAAGVPRNFCYTSITYVNLVTVKSVVNGVVISVQEALLRYFHVYGWLKTGLGLVLGFINNLQVVTTINSYTIVDLHNLQSLHTNLLTLFPLVFTDL